MGIWEERLLPRAIDLAMRGPAFRETRERVCAGLHGEVLEIGFGSGLNVPHYPDAVTRVYAVDPSLKGRDLAAARLAESAVPVEFVGLDGARIPLDDASVDSALSTWTLCTIPDVDAAVDEIARVLKPGGTFHFVEHGLAPDGHHRVRRWQHRWNPMQKKIGGGCHVNRPIDEIVGRRFEVVELERVYAGRPKVLTSHYEGVARH